MSSKPIPMQVRIPRYISRRLPSKSMPEAERIFASMQRMKFVKELSLNKSGRYIVIQTHPVMVGPFNLGEWNITLLSSAPRMIHNYAGYHQHQRKLNYRGYPRYCLGELKFHYQHAIRLGNFHQALMLCKAFIVNYDVYTTLNPLEEILKATMGVESFNRAFRNIISSKLELSKMVVPIIQKLSGNTIVICSNKAHNERLTEQYVEVKFDAK